MAPVTLLLHPPSPTKKVQLKMKGLILHFTFHHQKMSK